jgi:hypothetical protein
VLLRSGRSKTPSRIIMRATKEQKDRQNAEARERFLEHAIVRRASEQAHDYPKKSSP